MDMVSLSSLARNKEVAANVLRHNGKVPCVLYGNKVENTQFECEYNEIYKAYVKAGENTIVNLDIGGKKVPTLFHEVQFDPASDKLLHADFYAVDMKKEIEAPVPIHFEGKAPVIDLLGGILVTTHDHVNVRCLPNALPHALTVSLESISDFSSALYVSDLKAPAGVEILDDPELMIVTAQEPRRVEEEVKVEVAEGEGVETKEEGDSKKEGDEEGGDEQGKKEKSES